MIARLLISSSLDSRIAEIEKILSQIGITKNHPDLLYFPADSKLGIEQARKIKEHFSLKPYQAKGRVAVLEDATSLTLEAQNALLKLLEEPPSEALLLLGASSEIKLLPTVLSRCQIIRVQRAPEGEGDNVQNYEKEIEKIVKGNISERFEFVEKLKEKEEFLHSLVWYFHQNPKDYDFLKELMQAEEWANQNVNIRAILEYLMLVIERNL